MTKQRLTIAEIQSRLIGKSATEVFGWVEDLDGSIVLGDGMSLDSLGLTIDSAGTIQKAQDSSGNRKIVKSSKTVADLLAPQILAVDVFSWTGTSNAQNGATRISVGYKKLVFLFIQPVWASAPTTMNYGIELSEDGATWFSSEDANVTAIGVTNSSHDWSVMYFQIALAEPVPLGELAPYWRLVVTTVGGTANGVVQVLVMGVA